MSNSIDWEDFIKDYKMTPEEEEEMRIEREIIEATIKAREEAGLTQKQLSEITGIVQPSIAKIETFKRVPTYQTLIKLLVPLGYTLKVVPLDKID